MIDLKAAVKTSVSRRQRGLKLRVGDFFVRGLEPVEISDKDRTSVSFLSMVTGKTKTMSHKDFTSYALQRIKYSGKMSSDYLKTVWGFAGAKATPIKTRARIVRHLLKQAPTSSDEQKVRNWLFALSNEMEPSK